MCVTKRLHVNNWRWVEKRNGADMGKINILLLIAFEFLDTNINFTHYPQ